ncbi:hypothetical protein EI94DRAFT_1149167 [Lactarius quietus]|nr:hypothetical protein EI94DRAFT_1149167 [Lactarius quietus]
MRPSGYGGSDHMAKVRNDTETTLGLELGLDSFPSRPKCNVMPNPRTEYRAAVLLWSRHSTSITGTTVADSNDKAKKPIRHWHIHAHNLKTNAHPSISKCATGKPSRPFVGTRAAGTANGSVAKLECAHMALRSRFSLTFVRPPLLVTGVGKHAEFTLDDQRQRRLGSSGFKLHVSVHAHSR